jgi:hypothetical protein
MQLISASPPPDYFDLPAAELSVTQDADPLVIQRRPVSELVGFPQDAQTLVQGQMGSNCHVFTLPGSAISTIGGEHDCRIGENLSRTLVTI